MSNDKLAEALRHRIHNLRLQADISASNGDNVGAVTRHIVAEALERDLQAHAAEAQQAQAQSGDLHPATADLVGRFAAALHDKLLAAQRKYGYSDNWQRDDWMDECREHLRQHLEKGDPRDVAAYCAFLWHHGAPTVANKSLTQLRAECKDAATQQAAEPVAYTWSKTPDKDGVFRKIALYTRPQPAQDAKDAARYRWLREHHDSTRPDWHIRTPTNDAPAIGALDAAIDAAMAQESGR